MPQRMPTTVSAAGGDGVEPVHDLLRTLGQQARKLRDGKLDRFAHQALVHGARTLEHVVDDLVAVARMADADPDAPEILAQMRDHVFQPVVPAGAARLLEARNAGRQVELIVHDEHLVRWHVQVLAEGAHGLAAAVHVAHRLQEPQRHARDRRRGRPPRCSGVPASGGRHAGSPARR